MKPRKKKIKPRRRDWREGREQVIFFMFGGSPRTCYVKPENKKSVETILHKSQRAWRIVKKSTVMADLEAICSHKALETTPLEKIAENVRKYFLKNAGIDLLTWEEKK